MRRAYTELRSISDDSGSTKGALTCADLKHFKVALPPLPEQEALLAAVSAETFTLNTTIERAFREIALLQEYRIRLTADVVTGKLDVRGIELPAFAEAEIVEDLVEVEEAETDEDAELIAETTNADN